MCGTGITGAPARRFDVPPSCLPLLEGGEDVDPETIVGKVRIPLCGECGEISRRMVHEYETSPLPECDVEAATWDDAGVMSALAGQEIERCEDLAGRMLEGALATVKADLDGQADHVLDTKITEARVVVLSLQRLGGQAETDLIGPDG